MEYFLYSPLNGNLWQSRLTNAIFSNYVLFIYRHNYRRMTIFDPERTCSLGSCCITICGYANADFMVVLFIRDCCRYRFKPAIIVFDTDTTDNKVNLEIAFKDHLKCTTFGWNYYAFRILF